MSKGIKVLLLVLGLCMLGMVGVVAAGYTWFQSNKDDLKQGIEELRGEAQAFGKTTDQSGCMVEAQRRAGECGAVSPICQGKVQVFVTLCLRNATPVPNFCEGVPAKDQVFDSAMWANRECENTDTPHCARLQQAKQAFCQGEAGP